MFKVGDKVRCVRVDDLNGHHGPSYPAKGEKYEVLSVRRGIPGEVGEMVTVKNLKNGNLCYGWLASRFELIQEGPIRTVTKKELVPGVYGRFQLVQNMNGNPDVHLYPLDRGLRVRNADSFPTALNSEELRDAAKLFTELADYLEEQK